MSPDDVATLAKQILASYNATDFCVADILAYCEIESGFKERAFRFEPRLNESSYGLMQLLLSTAKGLGFVGDPNFLYDPTVNIRYGVKQLIFISKYLHTSDKLKIAAAYNEGVGNELKGYIPKLYVEDWQTYQAKWLDKFPV